MADGKYGELYTEDEVVKIVQMAVDDATASVAAGENAEEVKSRFTEGDIREVARTDLDRVFHPGEPIFVLRGQDKRALDTVNYYRQHQWPNATQEHLDSIDNAIEHFTAYRDLGHMKEPD
jgi:hypothetical protein